MGWEDSGEKLEFLAAWRRLSQSRNHERQTWLRWDLQGQQRLPGAGSESSEERQGQRVLMAPRLCDKADFDNFQRVGRARGDLSTDIRSRPGGTGTAKVKMQFSGDANKNRMKSSRAG